MAINVACPSCGRQYSVKDDSAGKRFKCKDCEAVIEVPAGGGGDAGGDEFGEPYDPNGVPEGDMPAPVTGRRRMSGAATAAPEVTSRTKLPAICMYVVCALSIIAFLIDLGGRIMGQNGPVPGFIPPEQQAAFRGGNVGFMFFDVFCMFREIFLIYAFSRMHKGVAYNIAMAGAIISVIPCLGSPCCILGIPFGIWALVVLNDPAVKAGFR